MTFAEARAEREAYQDKCRKDPDYPNSKKFFDTFSPEQLEFKAYMDALTPEEQKEVVKELKEWSMRQILAEYEAGTLDNEESTFITKNLH